MQWREEEGSDALAAGYDDKYDIGEQLFPAVESVTQGYGTIPTGLYGIPRVESTSFIKIVSSQGSHAFTAFGSRDGITWYIIDQTRYFNQALGHKGIATTSHGEDPVLWRFDRFTVGGAPTSPLYAGWEYWLIGDGGSVRADCSATGCVFPSSAGDAQYFLFRHGWGE